MILRSECNRTKTIAKQRRITALKSLDQGGGGSIVFNLRLPASVTSHSKWFFKPKTTTYGLNSFSYFSANGMHCRTFFVLVFLQTVNSDLTQHHFNHPTAVSDHLFLPYHSIKDIKLILLELINSDRDDIRKAREGFLISKGKTLEPYGMRRRDKI